MEYSLVHFAHDHFLGGGNRFFLVFLFGLDQNNKFRYNRLGNFQCGSNVNTAAVRYGPQVVPLRRKHSYYKASGCAPGHPYLGYAAYQLFCPSGWERETL
jgi:hypothetical protein